jgi:hypothetical protein
MLVVRLFDAGWTEWSSGVQVLLEDLQNWVGNQRLPYLFLDGLVL